MVELMFEAELQLMTNNLSVNDAPNVRFHGNAQRLKQKA